MLSFRIAQEMKVPSKSLSADALNKLHNYSFPGNIRELRNLLERALILGQHAELQAEDFFFPPAAVSPDSAPKDLCMEQLAAQLPGRVDLRDMVAQLERSLIARAIDLSGGVQAEAARRLGLSRSDFGYKVGKYSMNNKDRK